VTSIQRIVEEEDLLGNRLNKNDWKQRFAKEIMEA
jgi:hypothetical protein